jgi:hypothetical protein
MRRRLLLLAACAPLTVLAAQGTPPKPDTAVRADTTKVPPADTALAKKPPRDTIKTPTARPYAPRSTDIGGASWHWDRDQIFSSGAFSLGDLLAQVPGVTLITTGFLLAPQVAAYYGDPGKVRIYLDGVELDVLNPRNGSVPDLAMVPLWAMEDVQVERTAGELRVHLRSWSVDRTTPNTRTDVVTGTENLNLYRGFFGKRFDNGLAIQLAGQQQSSISLGGMDGDALGGMARVGWARGDWSVDATWIHQGVDRNSGTRFITTSPELSAIPPYFGSEGVSYLRLGWRDPNKDGPWIQLIASTLSEAKKDTTSTLTSALAGSALKDSTDTLRSRPEYVLAAGVTHWGIRLSSTNRIRSVNGTTYFSPGVRAEYSTNLITVSAFGEHSADSTTRADVQGRFTPFSWFNAGASISRASPNYSSGGPPVTATRLEVALGVKDRWISGGVITRSASTLAAPIEIDTTLRSVQSPAANGEIVSFRGPLFLGLHFDLDAINWSVADAYRPQTQARARLSFESSFLHRFPRNNFHVAASGTYEYFSTMYAPSGTNPLGQNTPGAGIISTLLEIRISTAVIFWEYRNVVGAIYSTYPGYIMPRLVNLYGVRWQFWN